MVFTQDEVTTIITLPEQDTTQLSAKPSILSMKAPEGLAMSVEYEPLYIFVSTSRQMPVFCVPLFQQLSCMKMEVCVRNKFSLFSFLIKSFFTKYLCLLLLFICMYARGWGPERVSDPLEVELQYF